MTQGRFVLLVLGLLACALLLLLWSENAFPATVRLTFHAPSNNADNGLPCGLPDSNMIFGTQLTDLKEMRLKGYTFTMPDTLLLGIIPAIGAEGDSIAVDAEILPGTMGVLFVTAVDVAGNESCPGGNYLFALPAIDPAAAAAISVNYEIVWKKP